MKLIVDNSAYQADKVFMTTPLVENQPKPNWKRLPRPGCRSVYFRVLLDKDSIMIANLRFEKDATIDKHSAPYEIDVICISGGGYICVGDHDVEIRAGQTARWPADIDHCAWTTDEEMETIMVERYATN